MNGRTVREIAVLGALSGMRSMAGLAALAWPHKGMARAVMALAASGEMVADKTASVGDRIDPLPLAGRALMGGAAGAVIAHQQHESVLLGGLLGAAIAIAAAHVAYHARRRLPLSSMAGGLLEDGLVIAAASVTPHAMVSGRSA
jgi:uncharacterized membrane protein